VSGGGGGGGGGGLIIKLSAFLYLYFPKCLELFVCTKKLLCDVNSVQCVCNGLKTMPQEAVV